MEKQKEILRNEMAVEEADSSHIFTHVNLEISMDVLRCVHAWDYV